MVVRNHLSISHTHGSETLAHISVCLELSVAFLQSCCLLHTIVVANDCIDGRFRSVFATEKRFAIRNLILSAQLAIFLRLYEVMVGSHDAV